MTATLTETPVADYEGWQIRLEQRAGILGTDTFTAQASKQDHRIVASAASADTVLQMIHSMIRQRETRPPAPGK